MLQPNTIEIVVTGKSPDRFEVRLGNRVILESSRQPLLDSARLLLAEGADSQARIQMRHVGSPCVALSSTVGAAAKLEVKDDMGGPRFVPFYDRQKTWPDRPPMRFGEVAAPTLAPEASGALCDEVAEVAP